MIAFIKPKLESVPLATGLAWRGGNSSGWLFQEKSDGCHEFVDVGGFSSVNAERMRSGEFVVNDLITLQGQDMRGESTLLRWNELDGLASTFRGNIRLCRIGQGGEFLEHLLREGGEGVVAKPLLAPFGSGWLKCKRSQVFLCAIGGLDHHNGTVELLDAATGQRRGKLALRSRFDHVRVGSVLKIEAFGLTERGMLREARLDRDTETSWLVSY